MTSNIAFYHWEVTPLHYPAVLRNCPKCGTASNFYPSGKFRINAQQKNLDVWLIYLCEKCQTSWNMTILSRVKPGEIPPESYLKYLSNDFEAALQCSFNHELLRRNGAHAVFDNVDFEITGDPVPAKGREAVLEIHTDYDMELRLDKLLSVGLGISRSRVNRMFADGQIQNGKSGKGGKARLASTVQLRLESWDFIDL